MTSDVTGQTMPRILLVEDDASLAQVLREFLGGEGLEVEHVSLGSDAVERAADGDVDLLVLDLMLPDMDGYAVCRSLADLARVPPVLMLTARGEPRDKLRGFAIGVDDYVVKPFDPEELLARIRALLRRSGRIGSTLQVGQLVLDRDQRSVRLGERGATLSPREFDVLEALASAPGRSLSRSQLVSAVWGLDADTDDRTVDSTVVRLRRKLEDLAKDREEGLPVNVATLWGVGYRLDLKPHP